MFRRSSRRDLRRRQSSIVMTKATKFPRCKGFPFRGELDDRLVPPGFVADRRLRAWMLRWRVLLRARAYGAGPARAWERERGRAECGARVRRDGVRGGAFH